MLLKNCTAVIHDEHDHVQARQTDILIEGKKIVKIGKHLSVRDEADIVDCTNKIVTPGFVDTHHHTWQTQLRGRHGNDTLLQYFPKGNFTSQLYSADDIFWGQLGGCLEMLECGTTTVVDFAHMNYRPENNYNAIAATASSGIRSVFCYCPTARLVSWEPFTLDNPLGDHIMPVLDELAGKAPFADGRVTIGFAWDGFGFMPKEALAPVMEKLTAHNIQLITPHYCRIPAANGAASMPKRLEEFGLLDGRFLMAHSSNMTPEDATLYRKHGVSVSSTPSTELQMSMGCPVVAFRQDLDIQDLCGLGVDCQSATSAYIPGEARLGLQSARAVRGQPMLEQMKQVKSVGYMVEEAFNLATIYGARAAKMGAEVGSIAEGKLADLVIFDATSPSMVCGATHDPVAAIMLNSSPADIDMVIVDGIVRKRGGKLVNIKLDARSESVAGKPSLTWPNVAAELLASREALQKQIDQIDMDKAEAGVIKAFYLNEADFVDST